MSRLLITASVGQDGANSPTDVLTVQLLLNGVPLVEGGPLRRLPVDGVISPLLIAAIRRFQCRRFGGSTGRIDPEHLGDVTILALKECDQQDWPHLSSRHPSLST